MTFNFMQAEKHGYVKYTRLTYSITSALYCHTCDTHGKLC